MLLVDSDDSDGSLRSLSDRFGSDNLSDEPEDLADVVLQPVSPRPIPKQRKLAAVPAVKRIPALARRNKINLVNLPDTLRRFCSYQYISELGPKDEGAIQLVKPIIKKLGGIKRYSIWSSLAAGC